MVEGSGFSQAGPVSNKPIRPTQINAFNDGDVEPRKREDKEESENENREEEEIEEARKPKIAFDPGKPTKKEKEEHELVHIPFRSWCRFCVRGRAVASPHSTGTQEYIEFNKERMPTLSIDYCFVTDKDEKASSCPYLVMFDNGSKGIFAVAVPRKGVVEWVVEWMNGAISNLGYAHVKIAIKSDQESSIVALREAVSAKRVGPTIPLNSPKKESQANGAMERAVRT